MHKIRLGIVEYHKTFRGGLVKILNHEDDFEVILQTENVSQLIDDLCHIPVEIILIDVSMPELTGTKAIQYVLETHPKSKIITLSQYRNENEIVELIICGVRSVLGKEDGPEELFRAIRNVHGNAVYFTQDVADIIRRNLSLLKIAASCINLSNEEHFLLNALCKGQSSTQIGETINKSHRTVEKYREELYRKFGVTSKEELILLASKRNLV